MSSGTRLPASIVPADDGTFAWLFFTNPLPGASTITLTVDGSTIKAADGSLLDAVGMGMPGSKLTSMFTTVNLTPVPGTSLSGLVADPGPDLKPGTFDDVRPGPDGMLNTADDVYLQPLAGVKVWILGLESQAVLTDAQGRFHFDSVPVGDVKLGLDGRTATNAPDGVYFPEMVMDLTIKLSQANTVMGSMGSAQEQAALAVVPGVYLPRLQTSLLHTVDASTGMTIGVDAMSSPNLTPEQRQMLSMDIPAGSMIGPDGQKLTSAQIGISTVPPELVRDMLPPGLLEHTFDITVQALGVATFSTPVPMTFPNLFNAAPGSQLNFLSFDHTTGRLVIEGTATVSADGKSVATDPGTGITHPGWHGLTPPGGPTSPPCPPTPDPPSLPPMPYTIDLQDQFFTDDSGKFEFGIGNRGMQDFPFFCSQIDQRPLQVDLTVDGPAGLFLMGMPQSYSFTLYPGQEQKWQVNELPLLPNIKTLDKDQFYSVQIHVVAYADGDPGNKLEDKIFTVSRYEAVVDPKPVVDPNASRLNTLFLKTVDDGTVRTKQFEYHLPSMVTTTFTASGDDASAFNFGGPVASGQTANWTFSPTSAKLFKTTVKIQVGSDQLAQSLTAMGTGVDPTIIGVNLTGLEAALNTYLGSPQYFDGTAGVKQASAEFNADRAGATSDAAFVTTITDDVLATVHDRFRTIARSLIVVPDGGPVAIAWAVPLGLETSQTANNPTKTFKTNPIPNVGLSLNDVLFSAAQPLVAKAYAFGEALQQGGTITMAALEDLFHRGPDKTGGVSWGEYLGEVLSHEIGHSLGVEDAYNTNGELPPNDLMSKTWVPGLGFAQEHITTLEYTTGSEPDAVGAELKNALHVFEANWNGGNAATTHATVDEPTGSSTIPVLGVRDPTQGFTNGDQLDLATVLADGPGGQSSSAVLNLQNMGGGPLTIDSVLVARGNQGFSIVGPNPAGTTLAPGGSTTVIVLFDPSVAGPASDTLSITSNDTRSPFLFSLKGNGLTTAGKLSVSVVPVPFTGEPNNNFGGVQVGGVPVNRHNYATVTNTGGGPLTITQIQVVAGLNEYSVSALPAGFDATHPVVLGPGQSFSFDLTSAADVVGLQRGAIDIVSDDPENPISVLHVTGTGLPPTGTALHYGNDYVALELSNNPTAPVLRQVSDDMGSWSFFLPPQTQFHFVIFDPDSGLLGNGYGTTAPTGQATKMTTPVFQASTAPDSDGDGLPDDVEFALGTNPYKADSDGDGLDDFTAVQQGLDPLGGRGLPSGIVARLALDGSARKVTVAGNIAYVATDTGLDLVDVSQFTKPRLLSSIALKGGAADVAVDPALGIAAAVGPNVLDLVDISDPTVPVLRQTVDVLGAGHVVVAQGLAYVGAGLRLESVDLLTGEPLQVVNNIPADGLALDGKTLYAAGGDSLSVVDVARQGHAQVVGHLDTIPLPDVSQVFAGNGVVYEGGTNSGLATADVSDPTHPTLLAGPAAPFDVRGGLALNGSGLALVGNAARNVGNGGGVSVFDTSDPRNTNAFLFQVPTASLETQSLAIGSGIAFVAEPSADARSSILDVVNYLPFDTKGQPPTVSLSTPVQDLDPNAPGIQVAEGTTVPLVVNAADDVQVERVELLVNGRVVHTAVSFPWNLEAIALGSDPHAPAVTVQVRATDTGGNVALSDPLVLGLLADTTPPTVDSTTPADGSVGTEGLRFALVQFSEPMAAATVTGKTVQLERSDGTPIAVHRFELRDDSRLAELTFDPLPTGSYQIVLDAAALTDRAGNPLGASPRVIRFSLTNLAARETLFPDRIFPAGGPITSGGAIARLAVGDLNGDGHPDLMVPITTGDGAGHIAVLLGRADGTFADPALYDAVSRVQAGVLADVNGDGKVDLVTANAPSDRSLGGVSVFLGRGDGTFGPRTDYDTGSAVFQVALGDVNGDGKLDIVTNEVAVLLGNGDGTFAAPSAVPGSGSNSVQLVDVNGDGKLDIVSSGSTRLGAGDGTFGPENFFGRSNPVLVGDLNGDGIPDLVLGKLNVGSQDDQSVTVMLGKGDGTFGPGKTYPLGGTFLDLAALTLVDLNGDGHLDLAASIIAGPNNQPRIAVLLGKGDGTFAAAQSYPSRLTSFHLVAADVNGDGHPDLITVDDAAGRPSRAFVLFNRGDGSFAVQPDDALTDSPLTVTLADVNGDGKLDAAAVGVHIDASTAFHIEVSLLLGNGDGTFAPATSFPLPAGTGADWLTFADFTNDGKPDLLLGANTNFGQTFELLLYPGNGDGTFGSPRTLPLPAQAASFAVGDIDGDGNRDLVIGLFNGTVLIYFGHGDGSFSAPTALRPPDNVPLVALGDLNGDGKLDLATADARGFLPGGSSRVSVFLATPQLDGSLLFPRTDYDAGFTNHLALGDVDHDGHLDVVTIGSIDAQHTGVTVLLGVGDGTLKPRVVTPVVNLVGPADPFMPLTLADMDGDGNLDLIFANGGNQNRLNSVSLLLGNGDGTFAPPRDFAVGQEPGSLAVGDLNKDGELDFVTANAQDNSLSARLNRLA
jgi:hypothetical protein